MAVIELNNSSIDVTSISHSMSRAAICRFIFSIISDSGSDVGEPVDSDDNDARPSLGDAEVLATRREVRYTADDGTILFAGKVLPSRRSIGSDVDQVEYTAADIVEYLGNNPADSVNEYYNRNRNSSFVFDYPNNKTAEEIIDLEFARLIGNPSTDEDHLIRDVDWSKAQDLKDFVIRDFTTKGKTWLQLLDDLRDEIPMLGYWFDPRQCDRTNDTRGYVLRFYNLSPVLSGDDAPDDDERIRVVLPIGENLISNNTVNVESFSFDEDKTQSYDKLTIYGWGIFHERYEKLEKAWDDGVTKAGLFSRPLNYPTTAPKAVYPLRLSGTTGQWERYTDVGSGSWLGPGNVWTPTRATVDAYRAFRRYKTPDKPGGAARKAINFKAELQTDGSGNPQVVPISPAAEIEVLSHSWYAGPLNVSLPGGGVYSGILLDGVKMTAFTGGYVNDWGDVLPDQTYYPDYPDGSGPGDELVPRFIVGSPAAIEENMLLLDTPLIRETKYIFAANYDGAGWNNMMGESVSLFWGMGHDVWAKYTAWDDLIVTRENSLLGFEKEMVLYEPRFFKYTKLDGTVIRDDTAVINEFADVLFDFIIRTRYYGSVTLDVSDLDDDAEVFNNRTNERDIFMGSPIQIENWKPRAAYTLYKPPVLVQSLELAQYDTHKRITMGFDNPQTFIPLERTQQFRAYFQDAFEAGIGGTNSVGGCGCGPDIGNNTTRTGPPITTTPPPISTGTGTFFTTTKPGSSSSGTTITNSNSDTTASSSTADTTTMVTTAPPGSTTTTPVTTTPSSSSSSSSTASSTSSDSSSLTTASNSETQTLTNIGDANRIGQTTSSSTTPAPAELYTGVPLENQT